MLPTIPPSPSSLSSSSKIYFSLSLVHSPFINMYPMEVVSQSKHSGAHISHVSMRCEPIAKNNFPAYQSFLQRPRERVSTDSFTIARTDKWKFTLWHFFASTNTQTFSNTHCVIRTWATVFFSCIDTAENVNRCQNKNEREMMKKIVLMCECERVRLKEKKNAKRARRIFYQFFLFLEIEYKYMFYK